MKLYAFDIPDATAELPSWLEQQLVGMRLADVVAELSAVHAGFVAEHDTLDSVLGSERPAVLDRGLGALRLDQLQRLLRQPQLLVELQELVLISGGSYWRDLATNSSDAADAAQRWRDRALPRREASPVMPPAIGNAPPQAEPWYRHPLFVCLTTAAVVLVGSWMVGLGTKPDQPKAVAWGWNRPDALPQQADRGEYLSSLATAADEWFNKKPTNPQELATRIGQFRAGCSTLILAEHQPLSAADRQWLVDKCRAWATKIDAHLAALETGASTTEVRAAMDDTVRKLSTALRERAALAAG